MKRIVALILLALLFLPVFSACKKEEEPLFLLSESGMGYRHRETGVEYGMLDFCFESLGKGEVIGTYVNEARGYTKTFYAIPGLDPAQFLTDENMCVYAVEDIADADLTNISTVAVHQQDAISVEVSRYEKGTDDAFIGELISLWTTGEAVEKPLSAIAFYRSLKLHLAAPLGICYVVDFYIYENGEAVLSVPSLGRTVRASALLLDELAPAPEEAE